MKLLLLGTLAVAAWGQSINYAKIEILTERYTPQLYMLAGAPGDADPNHPNRVFECELSASEEFHALANRIEAAGWTGDEAASALLSLAVNYIRFRRAAAGEIAGAYEPAMATAH